VTKQSNYQIFLDKRDPLVKRYLKDISKYDVLPNDEIIELVRKAQAGDIKARNKVVQSNLRYVICVAKEFTGKGVPIMDLINEGNCGLLLAIEKFDINRSVPFIAYARYWIRQYMHTAIYWTGKPIRLPITQHIKIINILRKTNDFVQKNGNDPTADELAELTGYESTDIANLELFKNTMMSLDSQLIVDSNTSTLEEVIPDNNVKSPDEELDSKLLNETTELAINMLTDRDHDIICLLFGLYGEPKSEEEVGKLFGLGKERIKQLTTKALQDLKRNLKLVYSNEEWSRSI